MYITLVELPEYIRDADRLLDKKNQATLKDYLALNPKAGRLIQGTGGVRKLRWARRGSGKSGGVRVIYYFHSEQMPLFVLNMLGRAKRPAFPNQNATN